MRLQVQKWGNSLALRIPKPFAHESKIKQGSVVDLSVVDGRLVVTPADDREYTLEELLVGVTKQNLHAEVTTGPPQGKEAW